MSLAHAQRLQQATLAARNRTGDKSIAASVDAGLIRLERVTYDKAGESTVTPLSDPMPIGDAIMALERM